MLLEPIQARSVAHCNSMCASLQYLARGDFLTLSRNHAILKQFSSWKIPEYVESWVLARAHRNRAVESPIPRLARLSHEGPFSGRTEED